MRAIIQRRQSESSGAGADDLYGAGGRGDGARADDANSAMTDETWTANMAGENRRRGDEQRHHVRHSHLPLLVQDELTREPSGDQSAHVEMEAFWWWCWWFLCCAVCACVCVHVCD